jgi:D-methionine transport system substrate-binding protein
MKKTLSLLFAALLAISLFAGCAQPAENTEPTVAPDAPATDAPATDAPATEAPLTVIKVGASITPHAEILAVIKDDLAAQGYDLQVVEFTDYV